MKYVGILCITYNWGVTSCFIPRKRARKESKPTKKKKKVKLVLLVFISAVLE